MSSKWYTIKPFRRYSVINTEKLDVNLFHCLPIFFILWFAFLTVKFRNFCLLGMCSKFSHRPSPHVLTICRRNIQHLLDNRTDQTTGDK